MDDKLTTIALVLGCVAFAAGFFSMVERFIHIARYGEDLDIAVAGTPKQAQALEKPSARI